MGTDHRIAILWSRPRIKTLLDSYSEMRRGAFWMRVGKIINACLGRWRDCSTAVLLIGASAFVLAGACVRLMCGSPYGYGMMVQFGGILPPVWLMSLGWTLWYALLGATFAATLWHAARCSCAVRAEVYRAGMLFLSMIFVGLWWYPVFFVACNVLLAMLITLAVLALCVLSAIAYWHSVRAASAVLIAHAVWLAWLAGVNVRIVFC